MLQLFFLAIICAAAVGRHTIGDPIQYPVLRLFGMVVALASVVLVMRLAARGRHLRGNGGATGGVAVHVHVLASLLLLYPIGWTEMVRTNWALEGWVLVDEVLILIPFLLAWVLANCDLFASATAPDAARRFVANNLRATLAIAVVPILVITTVADVARLVAPDFFATRGALVMATSLVVMMLFYPAALRFIWKSRPLPPSPLRQRLLALIAQHGTSVREIMVWDTGGQIANAALVGFLGPYRYVFLTDGLLTQLEEDEVLATFAHEMGHLQHRHLMWRMLATLLPVVSCIAAQGWVEPLSNVVAATVLSSHTVILVACAGYGLVVLGWYSRRLEFQADLFACRVLIQQHGDARRALCQYTRVLSQLIDPRHHRRSGWLHPSFLRRRQFLIDHIRSEQLAQAFHREMVAIAAILLGLLAASLAPIFVAW